MPLFVPAQMTPPFAKQALRILAYQTLTTEITELNTQINRLCVRANPALLAAPAARTLPPPYSSPGDNPHRLHSEASFCAAPVPSPRDPYASAPAARQANNALWRIAITRMSYDQTTIAYVQKRQTKAKPAGRPSAA